MKKVIIIIGAILAGIETKNQRWRVEQLPEIDKELMKSEWYSGYYSVSETRNLHFLLI
jgi:hypothetical protein